MGRAPKVDALLKRSGLAVDSFRSTYLCQPNLKSLLGSPVIQSMLTRQPESIPYWEYFQTLGQKSFCGSPRMICSSPSLI